MSSRILALALVVGLFLSPLLSPLNAATFSISGTPSGGDGALSLSVGVEVSPEDSDRDGVIYVAANLYGEWLFLGEGGLWSFWRGGELPAPFLRGTLGSHSLPLFAGVDLNDFPGVELYAGYGLDADDMLANGKYAQVYRVAGEPQRQSNSTPTLSSSFTIASGMAATSHAYDGARYLVATESDTSTATVAGRMVSADGSSVSSAIALGRAGESCCPNVAFDGERYLMVWEENQGIADSWASLRAYGRFVSTAGVAEGGARFAISDAGVSLDGMRFLAYGGGAYLITYTRLIDPARGDEWDNRYVAGRLIATDGTVGSELRISSGYGARSGVAFDGSRFFVVWVEDSGDAEVRGRFVSPSGELGAEVSVNASAAPSDNPVAVAFDGTHYLVLWSDEVGGRGSGEWDVYGRRVATDGSRVGDVIPIAVSAGAQIVPTAAFDGERYLVTWVDMTNDTNGDGACGDDEGSCWDLYGQYLAVDGTLLGERFALAAGAGNQLGGAGGAGDGGVLVLVNDGVVMGEGGFRQIGGTGGLFVAP